MSLPLSRKASRKNGHRVSALPGVSTASVAFTSAQAGFILDEQGRLWSTANGGRSWREIVSAGTGEGIQLAFSSPTEGFMSLRRFGTDSSDAYVLRTTDAGVIWHPQEITAGALPYGGLVSAGPLGAAALIDGPPSLDRLFFSTSTGGEVSGTAEPLTLSTPRRIYRKRQLKAAHDSVRISGTLGGAIGGEEIVVSRRSLAGGAWQQQEVVAGANGGSFSTTWHITQSSVFVAQWAGDNGHPGVASTGLVVRVRPH